MPKHKKAALSVKNVSHPNSRKAVRMMKQTHRQASKEKNKMATYVKQNLLGEKLLWFKERLSSDVVVFSKEEVYTILTSYLSRFDEELEQIQLKHSIGQRKGRQHASREDTIQFTKKREMDEFNTCGLEIPNLLDAPQVKLLREWNGELRFMQQFELTRVGKKHLLQEEEKDHNIEESESDSSPNHSHSTLSDQLCLTGTNDSSKDNMKESTMQEG